MISYFTIAGKRYRWVAESYTENPDNGGVIKKNLNGGNSESVGFTKFGVTFELQFATTGDGTYGGKTDVEALFEGTTAAQRKVTFVGIDGTTSYNMLISNKPAFRPMKNDNYLATGSLWRCPMVLVGQ